MTSQPSFTASLSTRLVLLPLVLFVLTSGLAVWNINEARKLREDLAATSLTAKGRVSYRILYAANRLFAAQGVERANARKDIEEQVGISEQLLADLANGNVTRGITAETDPAIVANISERERLWRTAVRPSLDRLLVTDDAVAARPVLAQLDRSLPEFSALVDRGVELRDRASVQTLRTFELFQWLFSAAVLASLIAIGLIGRRTARRIRSLADASDRISGGDLSTAAPIAGDDELATLGASFNVMTSNLREKIEAEQRDRQALEGLLATVAETATSLSAAAAEILAGTSEQAAGMRQQNAAVAQTVTTVDEVLQTAEQAAERSKEVETSSQKAVQLSSTGEKAVDETMAAMEVVRAQTGSIAESIVGLAEQAQSISDIIAAVTDVAEQTNLLALNASIEASRAGEHGRGFSVVAGEIKTLADQSKKATGQVRRILEDIQRATNTSVRVTEEGARSVDQALKAVGEAGNTIRLLAGIIADAALAAAQISASSGQQATGMAQIHQAMAHINQASSQNLAATRQAEQAAENLNTLGTKLKELLAGHGR